MKAYEELDDWAKGERLDGMAKSIQIKGAAHHESIQKVLCGRCSYGLVFRQKSGNSEVRVICNRNDLPMRMPTDIEECSQFSAKDAQTVSLEDMAKIALPIDVREGAPSKNTYL